MSRTIVITNSDKPEEPMKITFTGTWTPREIHAAAALVPKGWRQMMSDIKRSEVKETGDDQETRS